jgi:4-amino-4-deoxy-L-arabinose transferase-like glycosyltransferase
MDVKHLEPVSGLNLKSVSQLNITGLEKKKNNSGLVLSVVSVFLFACIVFFYKLGSFPLFNPDEALYAEPAREMLETGEYITTLLNYVVRFTKPPLCIWAMAGAFKIFGVSEFAARFFGASLGAVLVAVVCRFLASYVSLRAAIPASLTLVSAPLFVGTAREAITDMPLAFLMAGAQLAFFHAFQASSKRYLYLAYVLTGLAVMTKGPVAVVLPVAILGVYHLCCGDLLKAFRFYKPLVGALIIGFIALPWFATEILVTKGAYFNEFIMRENFQRFTSNVDSHKQPFWYHFAAMFGGYMPWTFLLAPALVQALKALGAALLSIKAQITASTGAQTGWPATYKKFALNLAAPSNLSLRLSLYCLIWASVTVVFFSMSVSKLLPYTLPAFPSLAILVALYLEGLFAAKDSGMIGGLSLKTSLFFMILLYAVVALFIPQALTKLRDAPAGLSQLISAYACAMGFLTLLALILVRLGKFMAATWLLTACSCLCLITYAGRILPVISEKWEGALPAYAQFAGQSQLPVIVFDMRKPGVPFYARRQVENINEGQPLLKRLGQLPSAYVLAKVKKEDFLLKVEGMKLLNKSGDFALFYFKKP